MSMVTVSQKRPGRVYTRKFDHDEARARYAAGETQVALAADYGVSVSRIGHIVNPALKARVDERSIDQHRALCDDCGGPCSHNWWSQHANHDRVVCRPCAMERAREEHLLSRLDAAGDIRCRVCKQHKPISDYRLSATGYPVGGCRPCETAARRAYRHAHLEEDRQWQREYKRRRYGHKPRVPVQDAAQEAAQSQGANRQARELPLCRHGYYATRCPHCLEAAH